MVGRGRAYFAIQAIAGFSLWTAVFVSPTVCEATLGILDPAVVAVFDLPLLLAARYVGLSPVAMICRRRIQEALERLRNEPRLRHRHHLRQTLATQTKHTWPMTSAQS